MKFTNTNIPGVIEIQPELHHDERGHFARTYCAQEFEKQGLELPVSQMAISHNTKPATLRGLHYIPADEGEAKLVRCIRGKVFDVAVDLRPGSPKFGQWVGLTLSDENMTSLYIPRGVAHGFITLSENTDLAYQFSNFHRPGVEKGVLWSDPDIAIDWPINPQIVSDRDMAMPTLSDSEINQ